MNTYHARLKLAGNPFGDLIVQDPERFVQLLGTSRWVSPGQPDHSVRLTELLAFGGAMFRVFSDEEVAVIRNWVSALPAPVTRLSIHPSTMEPTASRPPQAPARHWRRQTNVRDLYYRLLNIDRYPEARDEALDFVHTWLARTTRDLRLGDNALPFEDYSHAQLKAWFEAKALAQAQSYVGTSDGFLARYLDKLRADEENPADVIITDEQTHTIERVTRAADVVTNALRQWQLLLAGVGAKLSFVLQPMSYWTRDTLSPEEEEIFHAIDSCPNNFWRLFSNILGKDIHAPFAGAIQSFCDGHGIRFADMNELMKQSVHLDDYLFVDRVHFNDKGYDEAAKAIAAHAI